MRIPRSKSSPSLLPLGERIDVLVGAFNSKSMQENAGYLLLGGHRLCVAVPKPHPLAAQEALTLEDLHGEHLVMVKAGERQSCWTTSATASIKPIPRFTLRRRVTITMWTPSTPASSRGSCFADPGRLGRYPPLPLHPAGGLGVSDPLWHSLPQASVGERSWVSRPSPGEGPGLSTGAIKTAAPSPFARGRRCDGFCAVIRVRIPGGTLRG